MCMTLDWETLWVEFQMGLLLNVCQAIGFVPDVHMGKKCFKEYKIFGKRLPH